MWELLSKLLSSMLMGSSFFAQSLGKQSLSARSSGAVRFSRRICCCLPPCSSVQVFFFPLHEDDFFYVLPYGFSFPGSRSSLLFLSFELKVSRPSCRFNRLLTGFSTDEFRSAGPPLILGASVAKIEVSLLSTLLFSPPARGTIPRASSRILLWWPSPLGSRKICFSFFFLGQLFSPAFLLALLLKASRDNLFCCVPCFWTSTLLLSPNVSFCRRPARGLHSS